MDQPGLTYTEITAAAEQGIRKYMGEKGTSSDDFAVQAQARSAQTAILALWRDLFNVMSGHASDDHGTRVRVEADDTRLENLVIPF